MKVKYIYKTYVVMCNIINIYEINICNLIKIMVLFRHILLLYSSFYLTREFI